MKKKYIFIFVLLILTSLFLVHFSFAADSMGTIINKGLQNAGKEAGYNIKTVKTPTQVVGDIIKIVLSFAGIIFLILILYGGFLWMTAGGDGDRIKKARPLIVNALIGLIIIFAAYIITYFIVDELIKVVK